MMDHRDAIPVIIPEWRSTPKGEALAMWYVIQAKTGKENETAEVINKLLKQQGYQKCFVIQREGVWRIAGEYRVHIEPLFPSYVFVETDTPEKLFLALKQVPRLTKLLGDDGIFWTVQQEEEEFLCKMIGDDPDYVIRRSFVKVDLHGSIISVEGALKEFAEYVVKKRLRKRSIVLEVPFLGQRKRIHLGIVLNGD